MNEQKINQNSKKILSNKPLLFFMVAVFLFATTLRTPITVVGPIISFIRDGLGISNVLAGFLTTIPLVAFAIVSPFAPRIARKWGMEWTLFYSVILLCIGILLRSVGETTLLIGGTILIGIAIAFGNVLIPSYFKWKFPLHIGLLTGVYSVSMNISSGLAAGFSFPIATNAGWQMALGFSIVLGVLTLVIWIPILRTPKVDLHMSTSQTMKTQMWKSPLAWAVAGAMGFQSFLFYCSSAWLPEIFVSQGLDATAAGWMVSVMQFAQIPMTFVIPIIAGKLISQRPIVIFFTICYLIGFTGVLMEWTSLAILWMIFLGFAGGASFGLVLMLFSLRTETAYDAAELSGFAQSIGYLVAAVGPVLFGYVHDLTNSWSMPLLLFILISVLLFFASFISAKNQTI
ncbi:MULTISPECIES: CynX/NimT family MFS transporter [Solibacillus]|uniref:MFS transporter n=1 Tax=Solibacillus merdavium TaxID=2762218 RepID=A0ABR8XRI2_9BACL|nr:MFS transporter [Solibacillus merdavium]MBD8034557.1 MFS transporter [Solibacillus merdavium]